MGGLATPAHRKAWRQRHPEAVRAQKRRFRARHREELNVLDRARHAANPSAAVERVRQWRIDNPVRARELKRKSQATRRARLLEVFVEEVDPAVLWERDEGVCGICGDGCDHADYQIDHRVPLALGGEHSYANTQVAHPLCNLRKGSRGV